MSDKILKQLAEIMLDQMCAHQYAKSEKAFSERDFYNHKSQLELIISFMKKLEEENTAYNKSIE